MGTAIAVAGFVLFIAGSIVYIFVDFFLRRLPVTSSGSGDGKKRLDSLSVRVSARDFLLCGQVLRLHPSVFS